jgi:hypothetical protein
MTEKKHWKDADRWMEMLRCKVATFEKEEEEEEEERRGFGSRKL